MALSTVRYGAALWLLGGIVLLVAGACASSDPPPRSPLGDTATGEPATSTSQPLPTFTPTEPPGPSTTPTGSATGTPTDAPTTDPAADPGAEIERVAGEAISRLAEWTGVPETSFSLLGVEAVDWPSACLGLTIPSIACAEVITPGYQVRIGHAAAPTRPYFVHASRAGRYAWGPSYTPAERTIASVDPVAGVVTLEPIGGNEDLIGGKHRVAPGTYLEEPLADLEPGRRVHIAVTYGILTPERDSSLIVWLVPLEP